MKKGKGKNEGTQKGRTREKEGGTNKEINKGNKKGSKEARLGREG